MTSYKTCKRLAMRIFTFGILHPCQPPPSRSSRQIWKPCLVNQWHKASWQRGSPAGKRVNEMQLDNLTNFEGDRDRSPHTERCFQIFFDLSYVSNFKLNNCENHSKVNFILKKNKNSHKKWIAMKVVWGFLGPTANFCGAVRSKWHYV